MRYDEERLLNLTRKATSANYGIELMKKYPDRFDWYKMSYKGRLSEKLIIEFLDNFNLTNLIHNHKFLSEETLIKIIDCFVKDKSPEEVWRSMFFTIASIEQNVTEDMFFQYSRYFNLMTLLRNSRLSWLRKGNRSDQFKVWAMLNNKMDMIELFDKELEEEMRNGR